jgi:excinuclease UvrABC ATPase subunit
MLNLFERMTMEHYINNAIERHDTPYDIYTNIIRDSSSTKIVQAVRQSGKTGFLVDYALAKSQLNYNHNIFLVSCNVNMSNYINNELRDTYIKIPYGYRSDVKVCRKDQLGFDNGSAIYTVAATNPHLFRGFNVGTLLVDEMAFCTDNRIMRELLENVMHRLDFSKNSEIIIISTRKSRSKKNNLFWKMWLDANESKPFFKTHFKPFAIRTKDVPHLTKEKMKNIKSIIDRAAYDREFTIRMK